MIGIIAALPEEMKSVLDLMKEYDTETIAGQNFYTGRLESRDIVLVQCGIGKVAAGIYTALMIQRFDPDYVINVGCGGGLKEFLKPLDIVIADKLTYHDWDTTLIDNNHINFEEAQYVFETDRAFIEKADEIIAQLEADSNVYIAPIVSGDQFIADEKQVRYITEHFPEAYCADMESCAVAHGCAVFGKKFIIIRSFSDIVVMEGNEIDYSEYKVRAAERAALLCSRLIRDL